MIYLKYFGWFCIAFIVIYALLASFQHDEEPSREIFLERKWPYWIPDPFNLAFLAVATFVTVLIFMLWR